MNAFERRQAQEKDRRDDAIAAEKEAASPRVPSACDAVPDAECDARPDCVDCPAYAGNDKWGRRA